jgi:lysyl-tRNA synthetase class 1
MPFQIPYRHLVTLVQIGKKWSEIKKILLRTGQISKDLSKDDEKHLMQRAEHVKYWLEFFAPEMIRFEVKKKIPNLQLTKDQEKLISNLLDLFNEIDWNGESIHKTIYEVSEKENIPIKTAFKTIYQAFLGQDKGPRAGYFLSNLDKDFVLKRLKEAVK